MMILPIQLLFLHWRNKHRFGFAHNPNSQNWLVRWVLCYMTLQQPVFEIKNNVQLRGEEIYRSTSLAPIFLQPSNDMSLIIVEQELEPL